MTIAAGTPFGRYQIHSLIGTLGMSEVHLAKDTEPERRQQIGDLYSGFILLGTGVGALDPHHFKRFV
jgi:hypothetical protein